MQKPRADPGLSIALTHNCPRPIFPLISGTFLSGISGRYFAGSHNYVPQAKNTIQSGGHNV
ncbi:MAG: hypothetical protein NTX06_08960, partial [Proteobacteria bacterium]|nr:hypothetical protein [Pseudomonadota bacterium]